ncbi:hypothetical protein, partial [Rhizobium ruizarguesonis]|uniref:hypothetical protein n=1 Tax=Rhizobium ruizarguesonis TaxID=2081791 RepID=UPI001A8C1578
RAYLCHRHLLFKGWLKQPNPSNQKRIMQIPHSKCRASGFVQSPVPPDLLQLLRRVSGADSMALPVWQAEASSADDRWWLQRLSPGKDGGRERRDGV